MKSSTDETADQLNNDLIHKIHDKVKHIRQNRQMEVEYLKFEELLKESRADGFLKGSGRGAPRESSRDALKEYSH